MNQDILERLVIDRASGELETDAAALLDAWLARDPAASAAAAQIEETLQLAKRSLSSSEGRVVIRSLWQSWNMGLAACIVVAFAMSMLVLRHPALRPPPPVQTVAAVRDDSFWSLRRLQSVPPRFKAQGPVLIWKSPVTKPEIESSL